jgi:uncharacterized protein (TIGR02646 family)
MEIPQPANGKNYSMIELQHRTESLPVLTTFLKDNPQATPDDFDKPLFQATKKAVKKCLNEDQGGLCAYCESYLDANDGQIDHIKPKKGTNAHPHLAFTYTHYAHSCVNEKTCGQKKKAGILPIEPGPNCNRQFMLSTQGEILPLPTLTARQRHPVMQTLQMLGLESRQSPSLVRERKKWINTTVTILQQAPDQISSFLADKPFRYILRRLEQRHV